jgi:hypothetical protein
MTLSGGGHVVLTGTGGKLGGEPGLTLTSDNYISGTGGIGAGPILIDHVLIGGIFTNTGTVDASLPGGLTISAPTVTNTHIFQASSGNSLTLGPGTITNTGAVIQTIGPMSKVLLGIPFAGGTTIKGGLLTTVMGPDGLFVNSGGSILLDGTVTPGHPEGLTLKGGMIVAGLPYDPFHGHGGLLLPELGSMSFTNLKGTITNLGVISLEGSPTPPIFPLPPFIPGFAPVAIDLNGDVVLTGAGFVQMSPSLHNAIYSVTGPTKFTIGHDQTIQGAGQIGSHSGVLSPTLQNKGTIIANSMVPLYIFSGPLAAKNLGTIKTVLGANLILRARARITYPIALFGLME